MLNRIFFIGLMLTAVSLQAASETKSLINLNTLTKAQYIEMVQMGLDIVEETSGGFKIIANQNDISRLQSKGIAVELEIQDLTSFYQNRLSGTEAMGGFRTFSEKVAYLDSLTAANPSILTTKFSIGKTLENRDQWVVKLSDNPNMDEDEPEVLYISLIHAREPAAGASLIHFLEHMVTNYGIDPEITDLINNRELYFLPVQNPDGYVHNEVNDPAGGGLWRKNKRDNGDGTLGVDLNRNYGHKWGYDNLGSSPTTSSETYRGPSAFSEPETANVRDFIISREFVIIHNFHSYSNLEIWPLGYDRFFSDRERFYQNLGDSMTQFNNYEPGIGWTLYPTNGDADDWAWGDTISKPQIISLTAEIGNSGDQFWPTLARIPVLLDENIWPNLYLARIADNPYLIAPPKQPALIEQSPVPSNFTLSWQDSDSINPAVSYRLFEHEQKIKTVDDAEADNGYWGLARMHISSNRSFSGNSSWFNNSGFNRSHHWLVSQAPYLVADNDSLSFMAWYDIETDWDYFYAQLSVDGGLTFVNLENDSTTNANPNGNNLGNGITGTTTDWVSMKFDLSPWTGQLVIFRLAYFTDDFVLQEGIYIDDIENVEFFASTTESILPNADTSIDFTNKPAGTYYYELIAVDAQNQLSDKSDPISITVLPGASCCLGSRGNANNDPGDDINISDVSYLVSYLFGIPSGPAPECDEEANANGDIDENVNIADISFLTVYLFGIPSGPAPEACP